MAVRLADLSPAEREALLAEAKAIVHAEKGYARARALTPEERSEAARKAANARWGNA